MTVFFIECPKTYSARMVKQDASFLPRDFEKTTDVLDENEKNTIENDKKILMWKRKRFSEAVYKLRIRHVNSGLKRRKSKRSIVDISTLGILHRICSEMLYIVYDRNILFYFQ